MSATATREATLNLAWENPEPVPVIQHAPVFLAECTEEEKARRIVGNLPTGWLLLKCDGPAIEYEIFVGSLRKPNGPAWTADLPA
ncbi:MAG: hypothetical protein JJ896_10325 [Rhodothermales bacterium]|nr:hypothetical protein [Rhodothermales bacterium]MBO6780036.1 hypothetical protein [Rhodothermales bacterium]